MEHLHQICEIIEYFTQFKFSFKDYMINSYTKVKVHPHNYE